jgi:catalase
MSTCTKEEIIKRQITIFRHVSEDFASRLEKATGVKGYESIKNMRFNGPVLSIETRQDIC